MMSLSFFAPRADFASLASTNDSRRIACSNSLPSSLNSFAFVADSASIKAMSIGPPSAGIISESMYIWATL